MSGGDGAEGNLTLEESVPLATVLLQRLLAGAGVRSLAIKGPAFALLGVRPPKRSHDVDLIIHPDDRPAARRALRAAGWFELGYDLPPEIDDIIYSTTYGHALLPSTVDVHHVFPGLLLPAAAVFEVLWDARASVRLAGQDAACPSEQHALVIDALHRLRGTPEHRWPHAATDHARGVSVDLSVDALVDAAESVGARWTAAPLLAELGAPPPAGRPEPGYERWRRRCGPFRGELIAAEVARRAPWRLPGVLWGQLNVSEEMARFWAESHGLRYRNRSQVLTARLVRLGRSSARGVLRRRVSR